MTLVVNVAMVLWLGERVFSWWGLLGATYLPALIVAGLNLVILAVWELAARAGAPAPWSVRACWPRWPSARW